MRRSVKKEKLIVTIDSSEKSNNIDEYKYPIVGIATFAGGLAAFEAFFSRASTDIDPGMTFVLVQHLTSSHMSILTDRIRRFNRLQEFEVEDYSS